LRASLDHDAGFGLDVGEQALNLGNAVAGVVLIVAVIVALRPVPPAPQAVPQIAAFSPEKTIAKNDTDNAERGGTGYEAVQTIIAQRCAMCHGEAVQMKNVRLDSPAALKQHAQSVYQQVVVSKAMPMNNATQITEAERAVIGAWFVAGAPVK
jgi:uncharacterized membrane protein